MSDLLVVPSDRPQFRLEKLDSLEMNVNMVEIIVKETSCNTSRHESQHERQNKLFVSCEFVFVCNKVESKEMR